MRREENWAIEPERIRKFFAMRPDVTQTADGFAFGDCQIRLLGKRQQRTIVIMEGSETDTSQIYQRFFLQILSAGG